MRQSRGNDSGEQTTRLVARSHPASCKAWCLRKCSYALYRTSTRTSKISAGANEPSSAVPLVFDHPFIGYAEALLSGEAAQRRHLTRNGVLFLLLSDETLA